MDAYPFISDFMRTIDWLKHSDMPSRIKKAARSDLLYQFLAVVYNKNKYYKDLRMIREVATVMAILTGTKDERSIYALYRRYQRLINMELNELDERVRQYIEQ